MAFRGRPPLPPPQGQESDLTPGHEDDLLNISDLQQQHVEERSQ